MLVRQCAGVVAVDRACVVIHGVETGGSLRWEAEVDARVIHPVQMRRRDRIPLRRERCLGRAEVRGTRRPHSAGVDRSES